MHCLCFHLFTYLLKQKILFSHIEDPWPLRLGRLIYHKKKCRRKLLLNIHKNTQSLYNIHTVRLAIKTHLEIIKADQSNFLLTYLDACYQALLFYLSDSFNFHLEKQNLNSSKAFTFCTVLHLKPSLLQRALSLIVGRQQTKIGSLRGEQFKDFGNYLYQ